MPPFTYKAIDDQGRTVSGITEAGTMEYARRHLQRSFKHIVELDWQDERRWQPGHIPITVLLFYTQQLAAMIGAGVPVTTSLEFLSRGDHPKMNRVMSRVSRGVLQGKRLSIAMGEFPGVFPKIYIGLLATAEMSGKLHLVLNKLVLLLERQADTRRKLIGALAYPSMLVLVSTSVSCFIVFYILPVLRPMFSQVGMELPLPTRILVGFADTMHNPKVWVAALLCAIALALLYHALAASDSEIQGGLRYRVHRLSLDLPIFGRLLTLAASSQMLYALALMFNAGMNVIDAFMLIERITPNCYLRNCVREARLSLREGCRIEEALRRHGVLPRTALQMLRAGEESGQIDEMMQLVADSYELDLNMRLSQLSATLEPIIMAIMGVVIGFICVAAMLPIINFVNQV